MRHRRKVKYFGVKTAHRKAMFRNMVTSLFEHGRIKTTVARAKELRRLADKMITLAKDGSLHARRQALSVIMDKGVVAKLFNEIAEQMSDRKGGYTRIVRIGPRRGDGAMMCIIELVTESIKPQKSAKPKAEEEVGVAPTVIPEAKSESAESKEEEGQVEEEKAAETQLAEDAEEVSNKEVEEVQEGQEGDIEKTEEESDTETKAESEIEETVAEVGESSSDEESSVPQENKKEEAKE